MARMSLRNDRIPTRDGGREVTACHAVECKRKVVRAEHADRSDWCKTRTDVELRVDRGQFPRALASGGGCLAQLPRRARKLDLRQPRCDRQGGLLMSHLGQLLLARID